MTDGSEVQAKAPSKALSARELFELQVKEEGFKRPTSVQGERIESAPRIARPDFLPTEERVAPAMHVPKMEGGFSTVPHKGPAIRVVGPADIEGCWEGISAAILASYPRADLGALKGWLAMQAGRRDVYFRRRTDSDSFLFLEVQRNALEPEGILVEIFGCGTEHGLKTLYANANAWAWENRIPVVILSEPTSKKAEGLNLFIQPSSGPTPEMIKAEQGELARKKEEA